MKKLIISLKSATQVLSEVKGRLQKAQNKKGKVTPHFDIAFSDKKQFKKFIVNLELLTYIRLFKPKSIYELASFMQKDVGNISRIVAFYEDIGALRIEAKVIAGRDVKVPIVDYQKIEFNLAA
jgi:predicted transcriptional regulator